MTADGKMFSTGQSLKCDDNVCHRMNTTYENGLVVQLSMITHIYTPTLRSLKRT